MSGYRCTPRVRLSSILLGMFISVSLALSVAHDFLWTPSLDLSIRSLAQRNPSSQGDEVWFQLWKDSDSQIAPRYIHRDKRWIEKDGWLVAPSGAEAQASYLGNHSQGMLVRFHSHPWSGKVTISVNESITTLDLYNPTDTDLDFAVDLPLPEPPSWIRGALTVSTSGAILLVVVHLWQLITRHAIRQMALAVLAAWLAGLVFFFGYPVDVDRALTAASLAAAFGLVTLIAVRYLAHVKGLMTPASARAVYVPVLVFALCVAGLWYVFWPAILSSDSLWSLVQVKKNNYSDWHPAAYTLLVGATQWIFPSPASMILLQALALAIVYGWGVSVLYRHGGGSLGAQLSWGFLILSPVSMVLVVTLWKDVPYGISLLAVTVAAAAIYLSRGDWLGQTRHLAMLSAGVVGVSLFRHNGLPVVFFTVVAIMLIYRKYWRRLLIVLVASITAVAIVRGPVYDFFGVSGAGASHALFAHHIAAHLAAGAQLDSDDKALLDSIRPVDAGWSYECGLVNPTVFDKDYDRDRADAERLRLAGLAIRLALSDPLTELRHVICVGSLVWRMTNDRRFLPYVFAVWRDDGSSRYISNNDLGFSEAGWAQDFRNSLVGILRDLPVIMYRPAGWLYLLLFFAAVFAVRRRDWRVVVTIAPILIHSVLVLVFNVAQDVRYQYPVFLIFGLLVPWFLLAPASQAAPTHRVDVDDVV